MKILLLIFVGVLVGVGSHAILYMGFGIENPYRLIIVQIIVFISVYAISR